MQYPRQLSLLFLLPLVTFAAEGKKPNILVIRDDEVGKIEDTGPMIRKHMETADDDYLAADVDFIERAHKADKPLFVWISTTRMHAWTRLKEEAQGRTGIGLNPGGMAEHDDHVGMLLDKLDEPGIADNTIVINGAGTVSWPDGGITPSDQGERPGRTPRELTRT